MKQPMVNKRLDKILGKCKPCHYGNTWAGYLQPMEIMVLITAGYRPSMPDDYRIKCARGDIKNGICNPAWFYFVRNKRKGIWI